MWERTCSPAPRLNPVVIVMQNPLDAFHIALCLRSQKLTAKHKRRERRSLHVHLYIHTLAPCPPSNVHLCYFPHKLCLPCRVQKQEWFQQHFSQTHFKKIKWKPPRAPFDHAKWSFLFILTQTPRPRQSWSCSRFACTVWIQFQIYRPPLPRHLLLHLLLRLKRTGPPGTER